MLDADMAAALADAVLSGKEKELAALKRENVLLKAINDLASMLRDFDLTPVQRTRLIQILESCKD